MPRSDSHGGFALAFPAPRHIVTHAVPIVIEGMLGPLAVFYLALTALSFRAALIGTLIWSYGAAIRRVSRHERVSTLLILGIVLLTIRTIIAYITKSSIFYFAQPLAGTVMIAFLLIATALLRRPFTQRFAHDFCPLSPELLSHPRIHQFFVRVSYLWAATLLVNSGVVLWLLLNSSLRSFIIERSVITWGTTTLAVTLSILGFIRTLRNDGVHVTWGAATAVASPAR